MLALNSADLSSLGAIAGKLKPALELDNMQLGMLAAAPSFVAVFTTLPMGALADRARRVRWLTISILAWAAGMVLAGACTSFGQLLVVRLLLGAATAASGPFVASLVGDLFWPSERGRIYGYILAGEILGAGVGLLVSGSIAGLSWRAALWVLAPASVAVAWGLHRRLPEPARGGASRLPRAGERDHGAESAGQRSATAQKAVEESDAEARRDLVLNEDPRRMHLPRAAAYVLRIRTNVVLILASALGYFFQAGVNTFGVVFVIANYGVSQPVATWLLAVIAVGGLAGTVLGGRVADGLLARGRAEARMLVGGFAFILSSLLFVPGVLSRDLLVAVPIYFVATAMLGAPNAPVDAARLDVVPGLLWGRAEAVRTVMRTLAVAAAPLLFGVISDQLGSGPRSSTKGLGYQASASGLRYAFLLMLVPMAVGGLLLVLNGRRYTRDVATAMASDAKLASRQPARGRATPKHVV